MDILQLIESFYYDTQKHGVRKPVEGSMLFKHGFEWQMDADHKILAICDRAKRDDEYDFIAAMALLNEDAFVYVRSDNIKNETIIIAMAENGYINMWHASDDNPERSYDDPQGITVVTDQILPGWLNDERVTQLALTGEITTSRDGTMQWLEDTYRIFHADPQ